jgi:hypothetical protein
VRDAIVQSVLLLLLRWRRLLLLRRWRLLLLLPLLLLLC